MAITQKTVVPMTVRADCPTHARTGAHAGRFCPVAKVIRRSGTKLPEIWNVTRA